jgi:hypothetical protein
VVQIILGKGVQASTKRIWEVKLMSQDVLGYSSHDWRKNTDDAVVIEDYNVVARVNKSKVRFTNPKTLKTEEVDLSRLIRVFVNNFESHKRSVK